MRIGTWNLENLFRPGQGAEGPSDVTAYQGKIATLAATINALDPDVLAVQEVGDPAALGDLVSAVGGVWHTALATPDPRGIRVGLIARAELRGIAQIAAFPEGLGPVQVDDAGHTLSGLGRPALKATVRIEGRDVDVISVHLKSKLLSFPNGRFSTNDEDERARYAVYALHRRAAEAAGVRAAVTALRSSAPDDAALVVAGDLNDDPQAATTQILYGPPGSELGTPGFPRPDQGDRQRLWNLASMIPEEDRYSRIYRGRRELIDHILVSHAMAGAVTAVRAGPGDSPSIGDDPTARRDEPGSDHRPILAEFSL